MLYFNLKRPWDVLTWSLTRFLKCNIWVKQQCFMKNILGFFNFVVSRLDWLACITCVLSSTQKRWWNSVTFLTRSVAFDLSVVWWMVGMSYSPVVLPQWHCSWKILIQQEVNSLLKSALEIASSRARQMVLQHHFVLKIKGDCFLTLDLRELNFHIHNLNLGDDLVYVSASGSGKEVHLYLLQDAYFHIACSTMIS